MVYQYKKDGYTISTDKSKLQIEVIHNFLKNAYWCKNIPIEIVRKSIDCSLCYGIYYKDIQVGFARVVTDYSVMATLADVFIIESYRGKGLSKWLLECVMSNPELQELRGWTLKTSDAHGLYSQFGFTAPSEPQKIMELSLKTSY